MYNGFRRRLLICAVLGRKEWWPVRGVAHRKLGHWEEANDDLSTGIDVCKDLHRIVWVCSRAKKPAISNE